MKIIYDGKVYVQRSDINFLQISDIEMPEEVRDSLLTAESDIKNQSEDDFIEFESDAIIDFFNNLDFIVDYNSVRILSEDDIIKRCKELLNEKFILSQYYNPTFSQNKTKRMEVSRKCSRLNYKALSLRNYLLFKQKEVKFKLPEGVDYPEGYNDGRIKKMVKRIKNTGISIYID